MPQDPGVAILVASLALLGVLATAVVSFLVSRKATRVQTALQVEKLKHDADLAAASLKSAADLAASSLKAAADLQSQKEAHERDLAELEQRLQHEFSRERLHEMLNDANWKRVHDKLVVFRETGHSMIEQFKSLASRGHEYDDEALFDAVSYAVRDHQAFKTGLANLHSEIQNEHHERLYELQRYLIVVLLDVARTKVERTEKAAVMQEHLERIKTKEREFETWIEPYVQPEFVDDPRRRGPD